MAISVFSDIATILSHTNATRWKSRNRVSEILTILDRFIDQISATLPRTRSHTTLGDTVQPAKRSADLIWVWDPMHSIYLCIVPVDLFDCCTCNCYNVTLTLPSTYQLSKALLDIRHAKLQ